jgi:hypothetical protein
MDPRYEPVNVNPAWSTLLWLVPALALMGALALTLSPSPTVEAQVADELSSPESPATAPAIAPGALAPGGSNVRPGALRSDALFEPHREPAGSFNGA